MIINVLNRAYCKKLLVVLPGQHHPGHFHKEKEETFHVLWGELDLYLDGKLVHLGPGDMQLIERGQLHEFRSEGGCIVEEISTTHVPKDSHYKDRPDREPRPDGAQDAGGGVVTAAPHAALRRQGRRAVGAAPADHGAGTSQARPRGLDAGPRPAAGPVRRRVMVAAFRNRTWIEWAVYAACQLRRLGVATTLVYSSSEVKRLYPLSRVPGARELGFWAGVEGIPNVRLVDLDDWYPDARSQAGSYAEFAREHAPSVAAYDLHVEEHEDGPLAPRVPGRGARAEAMLAETGAAFERAPPRQPGRRASSATAA